MSKIEKYLTTPLKGSEFTPLTYIETGLSFIGILTAAAIILTYFQFA